MKFHDSFLVRVIKARSITVDLMFYLNVSTNLVFASIFLTLSRTWNFFYLITWIGHLHWSFTNSILCNQKLRSILSFLKVFMHQTTAHLILKIVSLKNYSFEKKKVRNYFNHFVIYLQWFASCWITSYGSYHNFANRHALKSTIQ